MNLDKPNEREHLYVLEDIRYETSAWRKTATEPCRMTATLAVQMNYARGLNGSPLRWIKKN